jgi:hypothetical protein
LRGVATPCIKQYREYSTLRYKDSGESIKNSEYFLEFEAKFEKPSDTKSGAWEEVIRTKNLRQKFSLVLPLSKGKSSEEVVLPVQDSGGDYRQDFNSESVYCIVLHEVVGR